MRRIYEPDKTKILLDEVLTELYLMKTAVGIEKDEKLLERISKLREKISSLKESL